jgi:hypothetical protein
VPGTVAGAVYDTASDDLAGLPLAAPGEAPGGKPWRHDARLLFGAVPQHSSPATPVAKPDAYETLRADFTAPGLPYSQPLDVNRSYLDTLRTSRFATMRLFRRNITEFAIDAAQEPLQFVRHQWRYPIRLPIAREYLHISPEEYDYLYSKDLAVKSSKTALLLRSIYGYKDDKTSTDDPWTDDVLKVSEFLKRTGLSYCEFLELQASGFVSFKRKPPNGDGGNGDGGNDLPAYDDEFPICEPCCLDDLIIEFDDEAAAADTTVGLRKLVVFIRLWRSLQSAPSGPLTMADLADVCIVLSPFDNKSKINPDFVRQLAALMMLRELLELPMRPDDYDVANPDVGAERSPLVALWLGPKGQGWAWAVKSLIERLQTSPHCGERRHARPLPQLTKLLVENLDALSVLAGFDPTTASDTWHAKPTCTLRMAEVLLKIVVSDFTVGEVLHLFSNTHLQGDDPFPLPTINESADDPLELTDDDERYGLWALRAKLLAAQDDKRADKWTWARITATLVDKFAYHVLADDDPLTTLGQHFFPSVLAREGWTTTTEQRRFSVPLESIKTTPVMWNSPPGGPFQYDHVTGNLTAQLPLRDDAVAEKISNIRGLGPEERHAVRSLYFAPRTLLARFAFIFDDFATASDWLIDAGDEDERFAYFAAAFDHFYRRCEIVCEHLAEHITHSAPQDLTVGAAEVWQLLRTMHGDENLAAAGSWEDDSGEPPDLTWPGQPTGGAFAALLGLVGTGLVGEFSTATHGPAWRNLTGPLTLFGSARNKWNAPVLTIIPSMTLALTDEQLEVAAVRNGFALRDVDGEPLHGAQPFNVTLTGMLLIEKDGRYEFAAGAPTPDGEEPDREQCPDHRWQVQLQRGQKTWQLLNRDLPGEPAPDFHCAPLELRRGCYKLAITLVHTQPDFDNEGNVKPRHTGFQVKYTGPDTGNSLIAIPHNRLYRDKVERTLDEGLQLEGLPGEKGVPEQKSPGAGYLRARYTSSLRDIRRTYQRAFKSALLVHRLALSAKPLAGDPQSELGYLLGHPTDFAGRSYPRAGSDFATHTAWFDPDLLGVDDPFKPPLGDERAAPAKKRQAALFDIWERLYDYTTLRADTRAARERPAWRLFYEASERQPDNPAELVRHLGIDVNHAPQVLTYWDPKESPDPADDFPDAYYLGWPDLGTEAWAIRAWRAERWLDTRERCFHPRDLTEALPHRWAADDPAARPVPTAPAGNENLTAFVRNGALDTGTPRRYKDIQALNDGLRIRARDALVAWLCGMERVELPFTAATQFATAIGDLSDLLLQDVACGPRQCASRIEDLISAAQALVRRGRIGAEPDFVVGEAFADMWDGRFSTFNTWKQCVQRTLYRENWIEWDELRKARRIEAFAFLEDQLRSGRLSIAKPGSLEWWPGRWAPAHPSLTALQDSVWSQIAVLTPSTTVDPTGLTSVDEGLDLIGTPDSHAQPSWLAPIPLPPSMPGGGGGDDNGDNDGDENAEQIPGVPPARQGQAVPGRGGGPARNPQPENGGGQHPGQDGGQRNRPVHVEGLDDGPIDQAELDRLPLWLKAAVRLGQRYVRVAAAGIPPASAGFRPCPDGNECCCPCDEKHEALVDEYYFWLEDGHQFADISQNADVGAVPGGDETTDWQRPDKLPALLHCNTYPVVYLCWTRVRHGEFEPPRRSTKAVAVQSGEGIFPQLGFAGRNGDSLRFTVSYAAPRPPEEKEAYGKTLPGFRYDLATESAVTLPLIKEREKLEQFGQYPGGLDAYPFFAYVCPGAPVEPLSFFAVAHTVAGTLRANCRYESALKWYELFHAPLRADNSWTDCGQSSKGSGDGNGQQRIGAKRVADRDIPAGGRRAPARQQRNGAAALSGRDIACCGDMTAPNDVVARHRAMLILYLETMLDLANAPATRNSPEKFRDADVICGIAARILGTRPPTVYAQVDEDETPPTLADFVASPPRLNPRLVALYDRVDDLEASIHATLSSRRLLAGTPNVDMPYYAESAGRCGCGCDDECPVYCKPDRFEARVDRVSALVSDVCGLGEKLLAAYEKGDAEYLASLRASQERQLAELTIDIRQQELRNADWQVQALVKSKEQAQSWLRYYESLIAAGLNAGEIGYGILEVASMGSRTAANVSEAAAGATAAFVPDSWVGGAGISSPVAVLQMPTGAKAAHAPSSAAAVLRVIADIASTSAQISLNAGGWDRRENEWRQQVDSYSLQIQEIERRILGAQRQRDAARMALDNAQLGAEHAAAVQDFLRDKFTSHDLYLHLQRETAANYYGMYQLARESVEDLQARFNYQMGHTHRNFLYKDSWDSLHEGLVAGDRLQLAVRQMEKAFRDENCREYELTKHISMRMHFPLQFLQLKATGVTEIEIPEWMFDLDYPGQYMRRIRNISVTIPSVVGPYSGVHSRVTMLSSSTRIDPTVPAEPAECCGNCQYDECGHCAENDGYEARLGDPRIVRSYGATQSIVTSSGQNDSGMFEVNLRDERYLPMEYFGAACRLRIELLRETNFFETDECSDYLIHLKIGAREGGELLAVAAARSARRRLPGDGTRLFDLRHDMPDAWNRLGHGHEKARPFSRGLDLKVTEAMFPFVPLWKVSSVVRFHILVEAPHAEPGRVHTVRFYPQGHHHDDHVACDCERIDVNCVASSHYAGMFYGEVDLTEHGALGPLHGDDPVILGRLTFDDEFGEICNTYLVLGYCADLPRVCGGGRCDCGVRREGDHHDR